MPKNGGSKSKMTPTAAARIQGHADKSGKNQGFKARAQRAGAKNTSGAAKGGGKKSKS
jgi:hypothetical protein